MYSHKTKRQKSTSSHNFGQIAKAEIERSKFDRSHGHKTAIDSAFLYPIMVDEVLPGDTINLKLTALARLSTPLFPVIDNIFLDTFFFFVPLRILWENFHKFMGAQDDPGDSTSFTCPIIDSGSTKFLAETIYDHMGLPVDIPDLEVNAFHLRAYNLIYNEFFRSQDLIDSVTINKGDGPDAITDYTLLRRTKRPDYFTSCLPAPQRGPAVTLPLGSSAPVTGTLDAEAAHNVTVKGDGKFTMKDNFGTTQKIISVASSQTWRGTANWGGGGDIEWGDPKLEADIDGHGITGTADLTAATASTVNTVRLAFQIQRLLERDARGGTRLTEIIKSHFGVTSPDFRLQRPEFIGGGTQQINIHAVPRTGGSPVGELSAFGISVGQHRATKSFTEHGVIIGLAAIRADLTYQVGLDRMWSRQDKLDFFWPALAHIGEQAVLNQEIMAQGSLGGGTSDALTFGFAERYAEYRFKNSLITGAMKSNFTSSLDSWHLSQDFATVPVLDETFINENAPFARISAVPSEPTFIMDLWFDYNHVRPMPTYGTPGMMDHF